MITLKAHFDGVGIVIDPGYQPRLDALKKKLKAGEAICITMEPWGKARTRLQQNLLHEIIGRYARANRQSIDAVKVDWKIDLGYYLPAGKVMSGEIELPSWRFRIVDLSHVSSLYEPLTLVFLRSESDYTVRMENEFIDHALQCCAGSGVDVEDIIEKMEALK